jgi:hypothetical protein
MFWLFQELPTNKEMARTDGAPATQFQETTEKLNSPKTANSGASTVTSPDPRDMDPIAFSNWWKKAGQVPINFYGKVVDEKSNALAGATVSFKWQENRESRKGATLSDAAGLFSLENRRGTMSEVWVSKEGYYTPRPGFEGFSYAAWPRFSPDPNTPVVFQLRTKGTPEPLIRLAGPMGGDRQYKLETNGAPTEISFFTGLRTSPGQGDLRVEFWRERPKDPQQRLFPWRCRISVPGGGLQTAPDEFPFKALEAGYDEMIEIVSEPRLDTWSDRVNRSYYVRLRDGKYGWIRLKVICSENPFFGLEALINPSGSRTLEYDKYLPGDVMVNQSSP